MFVAIIDKGQICEKVLGPFSSSILAISACQRLVASDEEQGFTCPITWDVYELSHVRGETSNSRDA